MRNLVIKLHLYAGLLTFAQLVLYGVAGLVATVQPGPERSQTPHAIRYVPFTVPPSSTDQQVADEVYRHLRLPLTRALPGWALRRTPDNDLLLDYYNVNGIRRVVVLERESRLRIEEIPSGTGLFLNDVHTILGADGEAGTPVRVWAVYNEFAIWCLLAFCVSGVYLWLSAQARSWWAWTSLVAGTVTCAAAWIAFR